MTEKTESAVESERWERGHWSVNFNGAVAGDWLLLHDRQRKRKLGRSAEKEVLPMEKAKVMRFPLKCIFHEYLTAIGTRLWPAGASLTALNLPNNTAPNHFISPHRSYSLCITA